MNFLDKILHHLAWAGWVIHVPPSGPAWVRGTVPASFVRNVIQIFDEHRIAEGWIRGIHQGSHVKLKFSPTVPSAVQQILRNLWGEAVRRELV